MSGTDTSSHCGDKSADCDVTGAADDVTAAGGDVTSVVGVAVGVAAWAEPLRDCVEGEGVEGAVMDASDGADDSMVC